MEAHHLDYPRLKAADPVTLWRRLKAVLEERQERQAQLLRSGDLQPESLIRHNGRSRELYEIMLLIKSLEDGTYDANVIGDFAGADSQEEE